MNGDDFDLPRWQTHTNPGSPAAYNYTGSSQQSARPPPSRIAQLVDDDAGAASTTSLPYLAPAHSQASLSRSASLSAANKPSSYYNSSVAYQGYNDPPTPQQSQSQPGQDDVYFGQPGSAPPKRSNTHHDPSTSAAARAARSPLRTGQLLDAYGQTSPYSPAYGHSRSHSHSMALKCVSSPAWAALTGRQRFPQACTRRLRCPPSLVHLEHHLART